ncbi:hypothetical protein HYR54_13760 [Candidatus Acetothermia bacterium]|nr:hypothetical protein [Candidatus Acetothermia bacterium]
MRKHLQAKAALFVFVAVVGLGWSILAAPVALTVTPYADLVRFATQGDVKELHVRILSLAGQQIFDSGPVNNAALDWKMANVTGRTVATGVYLYAITVKDSSGNIKQQFGKLALVRGQGTIAPPIITTPAISAPNKVEPKWTLCANPCNEQNNGDVSIATSAGTVWANFDSTTNYNLTLSQIVAGTSPEIHLVSANANSYHFPAFAFFDGTTKVSQLISDVKFGSFVMDYTGASGGTFLIRKAINDNNSTVLELDANGNAGLGTLTATPGARLDISNASNQPAVRISSSNGTNAIEVYNTGAGAATGLIYKVERATGNVYADGSFNCGLTSGSCFNAGTGADVAERIDAVEAMEAGDVVEIHPDQAGKFRKSQSAISRRVAGIISTAPAVTLGNNFDGSKEKWVGDNRPLLALAGRVPVKVLAKYGAIQVGDLLVSSPIPGYAMKCPEASQCIGAVIGKALEPLTEGVGKIEVQVMLR